VPVFSKFGWGAAAALFCLVAVAKFGCVPAADDDPPQAEPPPEAVLGVKGPVVTMLQPFAKLDRPGTTVVVSIGVNRTSDRFAEIHRLPTLKAAVADAELFGSQVTGFGVPAESIHVLTDRRAGRADVLALLDRLSQTAKPQDTIITFFSGHGVGTDERSSSLVLHDEFMLVQELLTAIGRVGAGKCILFLDACRSGRPGQPAFVVSSWISSAGPDQSAYEDTRIGHGLFTKALSDIFDTAEQHDGDHDGWLDFGELAQAVQINVETRSRELGKRQVPSYGTVLWQEQAKLLQIDDPWEVRFVETSGHQAEVKIRFPRAEIPSDHHLWLVVYTRSTGGYWPQQHVRIHLSDDQDEELMVYLGTRDGTGIGDRFTVALVEAEPNLHQRFVRQGGIHDGMYEPSFAELPIRAAAKTTRRN
jgi:hypothetical protein